MGTTFDNENKEQPDDDDLELRKPLNTADILIEDNDCFDERPTQEKYVLPDTDILFTLGQNKR